MARTSLHGLKMLALLGALAPAVMRAQEPPPPADSVRRELAALRAEVDSLRAVLRALQAAVPAAPADESLEDAVARLRAAAAAAAAAAGPEADSTPQFEGRQRALQALNPELSVGGDALTLWHEDQPSTGSFLLREVEFAFQATLDPYSRAKVIASYHAHSGGVTPFPDPDAEEHEHGSGIAVEEAYAQWVSLPGGISLTAGRFRQRFGTYNRWHRHALPWSGMPLPYTVLLGPEGLAQTGLSVYWLAPVSGFGTYEIWIETTQNANEQLFGSSNAIGFLGHLNAFYNLSSSTYLELAASGVVGDFEADTIESTGRAFHLEAGLSWRPPGRELYRGLTVRGAFLGRRRPEVGTTGIPITRTSVGGFVGAEVRLNRSWLAGLRYDRVEDPLAPGSHAWMLVPTLTWWQSEFVRLRGEYDWLHAPTGTQHQILIQLSFAMGPHKHENY